MADFGHVPEHFHMCICSAPTSRPGLVCHRLERKSGSLQGRALLRKGRVWMGEKWRRSEDTLELLILLKSKQTKKTPFVYSCDSWFLRVKKSQDTEASSFPPWLTLHGAGCSDWEQCLAISALACPPGQLFRTTKSNNWTVSWEERSGNVGAGTTARRAAKQLSSCKCYEYRTQPTGHLLWLFPWQPESSPGTMAAFSETLYFILR